MVVAGAIRASRAYVELFADDSKLVRGLRRAQAKLKAFGRSIQQFGRRLFSIGSLAAVPFALSAKTFANFESQMARVKALTGATESQFTRLEKEAKRLGATTVFSASQAAEAMSAFALAGFDVNQILDAIGPTLDLAAAGQIEIGEAADIAAKIMAGMGLSAEELGNAVDVMAKAMTTANTDLTMLGDAFKFVGPMAKSAGISLEEITAAIQLLSNAGIQGEMAGSTLRGILLSLTSPSAAAESELKRLGVRIIDEAGNVRTLADILADLEGALGNVGSGEKLRALGTIFPARQAAGAAELVAQGAERLREATDALGDATGTAANIANTQLDTLKGDVTILLSALEGVAIAVGDAFGTELRMAVRGVTAFLSALGDWIGENKQLVLTTVAIVAGLMASGVALIGLGGTIQLVAFGLGGLATLLGTAASLLGAILSPIGLVVAGLGTLAAYLVTTTDIGGQALDWLGNKFSVLKGVALQAFQGIGDALAAGDLGLAARILWLTLKMEWQKGTHALNALWLSVKEAFVATWTDAVFGTAKASTTAWSGLQKSWIETVDFLSDLWSMFTTGMVKAWNRALGSVRKVLTQFMGLFQALQEIVQTINPFTDKAFSDIIDRVKAAVDANPEQQAIDQEVTQQNSAADSTRDSAIYEREQSRRRRVSELDQQQHDVRSELGQMQATEKSRQRQQFASDLQDSEATLNEARREWQAALEEAAKKRTTSESETTSDGKSPTDLMTELQQKLSEAGQGLQSAADKVSVSGTFNVFGLRGMSGGSAADRTASATEETAKNTKRLLDEAHHGGLQFS